MGCADPKPNAENVIAIRIVNGRIEKKDSIRYNKDGTIDKRKCNKKSGESSEVFAFKTREEIEAILKVFDRYIEDAQTPYKRQLAHRNKMLFLIGINLGIRASDLRTLRWSFFFDESGDFKDCYVLQPKKQRKQGKFVKLYFNQTVKKTILDYTRMYQVNDINELLFSSQKGDAITEHRLSTIIKDVAKEAKIKQNVGSHSLRKTWGFWCWHEAEDKNKAVIILQKCFNHDRSLTTLKYIGILDEEISDMYNSIELGLDFLEKNI